MRIIRIYRITPKAQFRFLNISVFAILQKFLLKITAVNVIIISEDDHDIFQGGMKL